MANLRKIVMIGLAAAVVSFGNFSYSLIMTCHPIKTMKALKLFLNLMVASLLFPVTDGLAASWKVPIGTVNIDLVAASPALGPDGTIYISSGSPDGNGYLYSVKPDGTINWTYGLQGVEGFASPVVDQSNNLYIVSGGGSPDSGFTGDLLCLKGADHTLNWSCFVGGETDTHPVIAGDGTVYYVDDDEEENGTLFAIDGGRQKWTHHFANDPHISGDFESSPVLGPDGTIYVKTEGGLIANSPADGSVKWYDYISTEDEADLPPVFGLDDLYIGSSDGNLYAINPADGSTIWTYNSGSAINSRPALDSNGNIIFGNQAGQLYSVDSQGNGQLIFTVPDDAAIESQVSFAADGTIYVTSLDGNLYALQRQPDGTAAIVWQFATGGAIRSNPVLGADGTIYFCSTDGNLYAVDPHSLFPVPPTPVQPPTGPAGPPPTTPTGPGLTASACSGEVTLAWDAYAGATGYRVYRSTAANGTYSLVASTTTATTYTDTSVANGTTYYYVVLAVNGGNEIAISSYICVTPAAAPAAPTSLVVAPGNQTAYLLSWSVVPGAVGYHIKRATVSGGETTIATTTVTSYIDHSGLQNGTTYYYEVSAVDGCGDESGNSAEASATPEYAAAPVFTVGSIAGNIYGNSLADGGVTFFTFTVSGVPNSTWTVYSLPEGNYHNDPQIIGTITLDASGSGSFQDSGAGTFDWSSQFYQLVSGDVHSAIFGYELVNIIGTAYVPIQNPLIPLSPGTVGTVIPGDASRTGGYVFWQSSDGNHYDLSGGDFIDDSTSMNTPWDYEWVDGDGDGAGEWAYPEVVNNTFEGWNSVDSLPYGYDSDTYYFSGFPCDWDYGYPENYVMISFIGTLPQ